MKMLFSTSTRSLSRPIALTSRPARRLSTTRKYAQKLQFPLTDDAFAELRKSMMERELPILFESATSTPMAQFETSLADFIPEPFTNQDQSGRRWGREGSSLVPVPFSYHLVYFPPQTKLSELLPDSTDPAQSPGDPFDRRMWAGGSIEAFPHKAGVGRYSAFRPGQAPHLGVDERTACVESISDVQLKGSGDSQKIFVTLERRIGAVTPLGARQPGRAGRVPKFTYLNHGARPDHVRAGLANDANLAVVEKRNLVFMNNSKMPKPSSNSAALPKILKAPNASDHSAVLVPTAPLLFRFSALTFNAHRIHLDREYCRDVEGHRNLIVHGPLSCMLMCENLRGYLEQQQPQLKDRKWTSSLAQASPPAEFITYLEYRNLAPLYADEEMRVCLYKKDENEAGSSYDVWVENGNGSMCVKGTARTTKYAAYAKETAEHEKAFSERRKEEQGSEASASELAG